jgi:hypothetical protein
MKENFGGLRFPVNDANDAIASALKSLYRNPSSPARFAANRENCGKAIGLWPYATSPRQDTEPASEHQGCSAFEPA